MAKKIQIFILDNDGNRIVRGEWSRKTRVKKVKLSPEDRISRKIARLKRIERNQRRESLHED